MHLNLFSERWLVPAFFIILLLVGLLIYDDYGVSVDEKLNRYKGITAFEYVFEGKEYPVNYAGRHYGVAFELPLVLLEKTLGLSDPRDIYLMRHLCTFLAFYVSVFFFYLLCRRHFRDWRMGLLGCVFLVLSPRIFADSFYNSKDLTFMSFFIVAVYTMVWYLNRKTILRALAHALACALLIDIRIPGILVPGLTFLFVCLDLGWSRVEREKLRQTVNSLIVYTIALLVLVLLFWPYLWSDPLANFLYAVSVTGRYNLYDKTVLYMGDYVLASELPWHYIPVWMAITTPLLYLFLFVIGVSVSLAKALHWLIKSRSGVYGTSCYRENLLFILWFLTPIAAVIALRSVVYDGWRHLYFIYPAFVVFSLAGLDSMLSFTKSLGLRTGSIIRHVIHAAVILSLLHTLHYMVINHPHQMVYFNLLAGKNIRENFELDYWGLSYRQALEHILSQDNASSINVHFLNHWVDVFSLGTLNIAVLKPEERARLSVVNSNPTYLLSNYRWHRRDYPYPSEDEFYSIYAGGEKILVVYRPQYGIVVDDWLVCGAFNAQNDSGLDTDYINESMVEPTAGGECGGMTWKTYNTPDGLVDFHGRFKTVSNQMVAYAVTYVNSPMDMTVDLWYGSDCATKMWLNGILVEDNQDLKSAAEDIGHLEARLEKGRNMLLAKTCAGRYGWRLYMKIKQAGLGVSAKAV